jgi:hypothetical protein
MTRGRPGALSPFSRVISHRDGKRHENRINHAAERLLGPLLAVAVETIRPGRRRA